MKMCPVRPDFFLSGQTSRRIDRHDEGVTFRSLANAPKEVDHHITYVAISVVRSRPIGWQSYVSQCRLTRFLSTECLWLSVNAYWPTHAHCTTKSHSSNTANSTLTALPNHTLQTLFLIFVTRCTLQHQAKFAVSPGILIWRAVEQGFPFFVAESRNVVFPFIMWLNVVIGHVTHRYHSDFAIAQNTPAWMFVEHDKGFPFVVCECGTR
jgi:hypothetical protein